MILKNLNLKPSWVLALLVFCLTFLIHHCDATQRNIDEILAIQNEGDFQRALQRFQLLRQRNPENPRIPIYLGHLLTLAPLGLGTGIKMMNRELINKSESILAEDLKFLCKEIYFLYVSLRQTTTLFSDAYRNSCTLSRAQKSAKRTTEPTEAAKATNEPEAIINQSYKKAIMAGLRTLNFSSSRILRELHTLQKQTHLQLQNSQALQNNNSADSSQTRESELATIYYLYISLVWAMSQERDRRNLPIMQAMLTGSRKEDSIQLPPEDACRIWRFAKDRISNSLQKNDATNAAANSLSKQDKDWLRQQETSFDQCQKMYPGLIALHRKLPKVGWANSAKKERTKKSRLFFDDTYEQVYNLWPPEK